MKIRVVPEARSLVPESVEGATVVVIDTLRATTTIACAVACGIVVETVASIAEAKRRRGPRVLIAGERGGKKLPGFDLGNSPVDIEAAARGTASPSGRDEGQAAARGTASPSGRDEGQAAARGTASPAGRNEGQGPSLGGKKLVLTTTNGTGAIARSAAARAIYVGALVNAAAVARAVSNAESLVLVCAGRTTGVALEDLLGAGAIIAALPAGSFEESLLSDGARLSLDLFIRSKKRLHAFLRECESGRNLLRMGAEADVKLCAELDRNDVAPRLVRGCFR
ncbi:MAG: 2-phosphosulfolactate phosphatase [Polyangia bacterium]